MASCIDPSKQPPETAFGRVPRGLIVHQVALLTMNRNVGPPRRPPQRWKSSNTNDSDILLDDISESAVFERPTRTKSSDDLEAELYPSLGRRAGRNHRRTRSHDNNNYSSDIPESIDLSKLSSHLQEIQLEQQQQQIEPLGDEDDMMDAMVAMHDEDVMSVGSDNNHRRGNLGPTFSFSSIGSSMTRAQERDPGRFVTPASSFLVDGTNNRPMETCGGVEPQQRITVDPLQFINADLSFRLPLVGSLTDSSSFVVKKNKELNDNDEDDLDKSKQGGRKTIQVDSQAFMPTISLGLESGTEDEGEDDKEEEIARPKPAQFGLKREGRTLMRPSVHC